MARCTYRLPLPGRPRCPRFATDTNGRCGEHPFRTDAGQLSAQVREAANRSAAEERVKRLRDGARFLEATA